MKLQSPAREKIVRAIIDTGSQRSYIRTDVAREMGYSSLGELEVSHTLFGGVKSMVETHCMFKVYANNLDNSYACNFTAMSQDIICGSIASIERYVGKRNDTWVKELRRNNISLSDIGGRDSTIDILIGAEIAGKLTTGKRFELSNGLTKL